MLLMVYIPFATTLKILRGGWTEKHSRRDTLTSLAEMTGLGALLCLGGPKILKELQPKVPNASEVSVYETPGASHQLIHVKQIHELSYEISQAWKDRLKEVWLDRIKEVHADIYQIVSHLIDNYSVREVYAESMGRGDKIEIGALKDYQDRINDMQEKIHEIEFLQSMSKDPEEITHYQKTKAGLEGIFAQAKSETMEEIIKRAKSGTNAVFKLSLEGKILVKGTEDREVNARAVEKAKQKNFDSPEVMDAREDVVLNIIAKDKAPYAIVVYGAKHAWKDNIDRWNAAHPDQKFSLTEITPAAYAKYFGK